MKIKMLNLSATPEGVRHLGMHYEVSAAEAKVLIESGNAVPSKTAAPVEDTRAAKTDADENADALDGKGKGKGKGKGADKDDE